MIKIEDDGINLDLIETENGYTIYQIPSNSLNEAFHNNETISDWIYHLSGKSFTTESNKLYLYQLAIEIEKRLPKLFNWQETFFMAEREIYYNTIINHQNKRDDDKLRISSFSELKIDFSELDNPSILSSISYVVQQNLAKYGL